MVFLDLAWRHMHIEWTVTYHLPRYGLPLWGLSSAATMPWLVPHPFGTLGKGLEPGMVRGRGVCRQAELVWRQILVHCCPLKENYCLLFRVLLGNCMFWIVRIKHASVLVHKNRSPRYQQFLLHGSYFATAFLLLTSWTQSPIMQGYLYLTVLVQINMFWLNLSTSWLRITAIEFDTDLWWVM